MTNDWDLNCYYNDAHWLFTFHLNLFYPGKFYGYNFNDTFYNLEVIKNGIIDFVWNGSQPTSRLNGIVMNGDYTIEIKIEDNKVSGYGIAISKISKRLNFFK